ncbi:MAG: RNA-binding transcriptional accessory protein [candidate division Zixibacteria bacterium]|nr:RNA-binding transcriptional accessory protein [candidate division Zixibacteria bacterium]MBU1470890.1 RNA-binding transcriptional accessory protein [candidate division Zixibacteria bacterium]MBU2624268.1 RNA-binding transcriptional accessory protein [candidate division Zixibacteria bacterium]
MNSVHTAKIATELSLASNQIEATLSLLDDAATVPFIARYRKEATGSLDEVAITNIRDRIAQLRELDKRREAILKSLEERDLLTDELKQELEAAESIAVLEDIYLPYRPKRRTRATIARERGLEPLAELIFEQDDIDPELEADSFIDPEKEVETIEDALSGARDVISEWINEDSDARAKMRRLFTEQGVIQSKVISGKETEGAKYSDYFDWEEPITGAASHRILALRRGENESILSLHIAPPEEDALAILDEMFVTGDNAASEQVRLAVQDGYKRLLSPAMETEIRADSKLWADEEAIKVFADNLRELLMASPLGRKNVLAIDPGFRTGCKVVCLDKQGKFNYNTTIFPTGSEKQKSDAANEIEALCGKYKIQVIAIGNGTAGRETEAFVRAIGLPDHIQIEMVNESGASVYSASEVAREEFPDQDITVRGAVSIGRRLIDPLAELVKIDPKSIGVGQYQHDVDQSALKQGLDDTVMSCVNAVGVEVNTASKQLLTYVSGLGPSLAKNIVAYRDEKGAFRSRHTLTKVTRLGPKAFEQAAGFLRIADSDNPLDRSAVHPESYHVVEKMASDLGCTVEDLMTDDSLRSKIDLKQYITDKVGMPTLRDIMDELAKPGRDPRSEYESFSFDESVQKIDDLEVGMVLPGIVTNVTNFGAFVDIGVHQDGLVHISELADRFVSHPSDVVKVHQKVTVTVLEIDLPRNRIALSMREKPTIN